MIYYPTEAEARAAGPDPSRPKYNRLAVCRYDGGDGEEIAFWFWSAPTTVRAYAYQEIAKRVGMKCSLADRLYTGNRNSFFRNISRKSPKSVRLAAARDLLARIEATPDETEAVK